MKMSKFGSSVALATLLGWFGVACSDAGNEGGVEPEGMQLGVAQQAFSEVSCGRDSVTPHLSVNGSLGDGIISPASYNKCTKSYIVDLNDLDASEAGTGTLHDAGFRVTDLGPGGGGADACNAIEAGIIVYERVNGRWEALERRQAHGFFVPGPPDLCFPARVSFFGVEAGKTYRIAATVRDIDNNTRTLRIDHAPAEDVQPPPR
jgi:hypothetical protein